MMKNQLTKFKASITDLGGGETTYFTGKGSVLDLKALLETFAVQSIKIVTCDGLVLRLVRDGNAKRGQFVDTFQ